METGEKNVEVIEMKVGDIGYLHHVITVKYKSEVVDIKDDKIILRILENGYDKEYTETYKESYLKTNWTKLSKLYKVLK